MIRRKKTSPIHSSHFLHHFCTAYCVLRNKKTASFLICALDTEGKESKASLYLCFSILLLPMGIRNLVSHGLGGWSLSDGLGSVPWEE